MTGGTSELKVADVEVQKICDEVCSTFCSICAVWSCVNADANGELDTKRNSNLKYYATCCTVILTCEKKPSL